MTDDPIPTPDLGAPDPMTAATATSAPPTEASPAPPTEASPAPPTEAPPTLDPGDAALFGVIDRLAAILDHSDLVELEIQVGRTGLTLRKPTALAPAVTVAAGPGAAGAADGTSAAGSAADTGHAAIDQAPPARPSVKAPLTGIWYGSPAPGSAPYIQVGGEVAVGQVIGLIEAMKLFNEIKSDLAGRVLKVNAENGKLVKAKQPLIEVAPL